MIRWKHMKGHERLVFVHFWGSKIIIICDAKKNPAPLRGGWKTFLVIVQKLSVPPGQRSKKYPPKISGPLGHIYGRSLNKFSLPPCLPLIGVLETGLQRAKVASPAWPMVSWSTFLCFNHVCVVGRPDLASYVTRSWRHTCHHLSWAVALTENKFICNI